MHAEAHQGLDKMIRLSGIDPTSPYAALDMGGADYNGTGREHFPHARWTGLDLRAGPGVDIVADAASWKPDRLYDLVVSTELLEHARDWRGCLRTAAMALSSPLGTGWLFITCASTGRNPHSCTGPSELAEGEHYGNVDPHELGGELALYFSEHHVEYNAQACDVYAWAKST